ncbi:MAG: efflux RND transporter periplasmic adaptor subunit [Deltaproteobacteria bacterium]|nr:efflux RND transporter periplasmic adaptor subunit [Deltaproteobacteria bacterium]
MKRILSWLFVLFVVFVIGSAFLYLFKKSRSKPVVFMTETAEIADIVRKTVATGSIVPRREVEVKPKVSGVLAELYVAPGKKVKQGDAIGKISIVPDAMQINQAQAAARSAQIAFDNAKRELARNEALFKTGVVADAELQRFRTDFALREQEVSAAGSNLQLVKEGATRGQGNASTLVVTATVTGVVIDVPVKVGYSVIQANNFNAGTTVAIIADMDDMIFEGRVDEAEVAKIKEEMKLAIKVGAIEKDRLEGKLEYISPKGKLVDGAIQFEIKASVTLRADVMVRANYSANADIVLEEKKQVLTIREALVQYDDKAGAGSGSAAKQAFVEVESTPQTFVRKDVQLGLSDGIKVELIGTTISKTDKIKIPDNAGPAVPKGGPPKK